jgi:hypothetical protein
MTMPQECDNYKIWTPYKNLVLRKRIIRQFSQAPSTSLVHRDKGTDDPPMAIVEEEIPTTSIIIMSASLPYTITNPHDPPLISHSTPGGVRISDW